MFHRKWRRFLAAALALMLAGALAGCGSEEPPATTAAPETTAPTQPTTEPTAPTEPAQPDPDDPQAQIDALRAELTEVSCSVMTFYVGADFLNVEAADHACYTTDTVTLRATAMHKDHLDNTIIDLETFAAAYIGLLSPEGTEERVEHLGRELIIYATGTATTVTGLYLLEDTLGIIEVTADPAVALETVMDYAVLGKLTGTLEPPAQVGVAHSLGGLSLVLDATFQPGYQDETYANYYNEDISVTMSLEPPQSGITTASDMAASFAQSQAQYWAKIERKTRNGVPYVICMDNEQKQCLMVGFYVAGDTAWTITAESFRPEDSRSQMVKIITGGQIQSQEPVPPAPGGQTVTCNGLELQISNIYTVEASDFGVTCFYDGTTITLICSTEETATLFDDTADMAAYQVSRYEGQWDETEIRERGGVTYVLFQNYDGYTKLTACYVSEGKNWDISAYGYWDDNELDAMIQTVTAGIIL